MESIPILFGKYNGLTEIPKVKLLFQLVVMVESLNGQWEKALNSVTSPSSNERQTPIKKILSQVLLLMVKTRKEVWHSSIPVVSVLTSQEEEVVSTTLLQLKIAVFIIVKLHIQINPWWTTTVIKAQSTEWDVIHSGILKIAQFSWHVPMIGQLEYGAQRNHMLSLFANKCQMVLCFKIKWMILHGLPSPLQSSHQSRMMDVSRFGISSWIH